MSEDNQAVESQVDESDSNSTVDAISAVSLVLLGVCIAIYWVSNQV